MNHKGHKGRDKERKYNFHNSFRIAYMLAIVCVGRYSRSNFVYPYKGEETIFYSKKAT